MKNATTPELVTCHIFAELSLSWANGNIILSQAGKPILSASDPWEALPVKAITLGAINYGRYGAEWKFPRHLGNIVDARSIQGFSPFKKFLDLTKRQNVVW